MMFGFIQTCPCVLLILLVLPENTEGKLARGLGSQDEVNLVKYLFEEKNYNPLIRPVKNINESIEVQFNLALSQLISVDEKNQVMKTNVWLQMYWYDYQLKWNPDDYGGIKTIRILNSKAWRPDIVLFNNADGEYEVTYESNVVLGFQDPKTNIYQVPPAIYKSSCDINVDYFPFDEQVCEMKFGSWTFEENQLNFTYYKFFGLDMTDYLKSGTWDIVDCPCKIVICHDVNTGKKKAMYIAEFRIRRKTLFYTVNLIIPCMLISFVSICVFMLPADAGEKITLIISILLALVVFLLLISKMLPPSKTIPLIAKYLLFTFIMNIIAIGSTVFIINRNYRTPRTHRMPDWVRVVFLRHLPRLLLMERPDQDARSQKPSEEHLKVYSMECIVDNHLNTREHNDDWSAVHRRQCKLNPGTPDSESEEQTMSLSPSLLEATDAIKFITEHLRWEDRYESVTEDWKYVASVIDRLLLYIFLIVTICGTIGIMMQAPYILEYIDQDQLIQSLMAKYNLSNGPPPPQYKNAPC